MTKMYHMFEILIKKYHLISFLENLDIDIINLLKFQISKLHLDIEKYKQSCNKVHRLIDMAFKDEEFEIKSFHLLLSEDAYDDENQYKRLDSAMTFKNNLNSPIHFFPLTIFETFEKHVNMLYSGIWIYHVVDIFISPQKFLKMNYIIHNSFENVDSEKFIGIENNLNTTIIINILTMIFYSDDQLEATDEDCFIYKL